MPNAELATAQYELWGHEECVHSAVSGVLRDMPHTTVLEATGWGFRLRPESGAAVGLCSLHDEKSPSLYVWPSHNCLCHGCGWEGITTHFLLDEKFRPLRPFDESTRRLGFAEELIAKVDKLVALRDRVSGLASGKR